MLKHFLFFIILGLATYISWSEYRDLKTRLIMYEQLYIFAQRAEQNLYNEHEDIDNIIRGSFVSRNNKKITCFPLSTDLLLPDDQKALREYVSEYKTLTFDRIVKESEQFTSFAKDALAQQRNDFQKRLPALSVPPTIAFIIVLLIV